MKPKSVLVVLLLAWIQCSVAQGNGLPRSTPEAEGVSSAAIREFVEAADQNIQSLHSFMLVRHGKVIAEAWWAPYEARSPHVLFSLSKSFASTAVGLAVADGKLSVNDEVLKFFPEHAPAEPSQNLKSMRVRDLLRMNTGHRTEPPRPADESWVKAFLHHPVEFKPGTHFLYNTPASYMLAAIVEKVTGKSLMEYLEPRLFTPLGITGATWDKSPEGITLGGYGLKLRTEDIARFGQMYLQKGEWNGRRILPESWVSEATSYQTSNGSHPASDWDQGYGYQFWRCRNNAFRGDGAFGQYCVVLPEKDAVIAITSGLGNMQAVLNLVWEKLLPAMGATALPADEQAASQLRQTLERLQIPPQANLAAGREVYGRKYILEENPAKLTSVRLEKSAQGEFQVVTEMSGREISLPCGNNQWRKLDVPWTRGAELLPGEAVQKIATSGGWSTENTFTMKACLYETPFIQTLRLTFSGDGVRVQAESNVGFGPTRQPEITGKVAK